MLSESVYKALVATGGEEAQGTAEFVKMFDHFFDCLNVNSFIAGKHKRKIFQDPYTDHLLTSGSRQTSLHVMHIYYK